VEAQWFVISTVNVILTRQTCGQRSSRAAESKRRALENDFSEWICYMFLASKCRGVWDLGLCTFWVLAKRKPLRNAKFRCFLRAKHIFFLKSPLCSGSLFASTQKVHRPRSQSYILTFRTYSKFSRKNNFLALGVYFPPSCSSAGRRFATSWSRFQYYHQIISFPQQKIRWNAL